jgi:hypothetical protein
MQSAKLAWRVTSSAHEQSYVLDSPWFDEALPFRIDLHAVLQVTGPIVSDYGWAPAPVLLLLSSNGAAACYADPDYLGPPTTIY